jgi:4-amino-4-deoxy-L-arabinose transferase-like glycosyltransferase
MPVRPPSFRARLTAIAGAGVLVRALYLFTIARDVTGIGDWHFYHRQANLIAQGLGFVDPFQLDLGNGGPSAGHPPLYPLALSVLSAVGADSTLWHRALGLPLGFVTIVLVGLLGRRVGGDRTGLVAAAVAAAYPVFVAVDGALMSETLYSPLVAGVLLCALALLRRPVLPLAALLGALVGLAALTRSEALLFAPLLAALLAALTPARRVAPAVVTLVACAAVVAPWTVRNAIVFDRFVPISTNDATVVAGANCDLTYHGRDLGAWNIRCISPRRHRDEAEQAAVWRDEGLAYARDHAGRLPAVAAVRLLRVWDLWQPRRQVEFAEGRHRRVQQAGIAVYFLLVVLAFAGIAALLRAGARRELLVLLSPVVVVCVTAVAGYGVTRLRHSAELPLVVLAAAGLLLVAERARARRVRVPA